MGGVQKRRSRFDGAGLLCLSFFLALAKPIVGQERTAALAPTAETEALSFEDLVALSSTANPAGVLADRLNALLTTPFLHNDVAKDTVRPREPTLAGHGSAVRVGVWNIARGLNFEQILWALGGSGEYRSAVLWKDGASENQKRLVATQLAALHEADVLILNEVDAGLKRTEYRDVARDLAVSLGMNYVYGVEFVEVDPIFELGIEEIHLENRQQDAELQKDLRVDRKLYRGLHGTAILSRYPIRRARILRLPVCYDWFREEARAVSKLEKGRRWTARKLFRERIERELRHGGRMALIADVAIPGLPTSEATVVAVHLENKCAPVCRRRQLEALLSEIKEERNPVILAGDFNTTSRDNIPTSFRNEVMKRVVDYKFWISQTASHFNPVGIFQYALVPVRFLHGYNDPTAFHVPIFWDNRERGLFKTIEKFRFADGYAFDFRGQPERAVQGKRGTLADSNERASKGFVPTYTFNRDFGGLGRFKLDWVFVKPFIRDPRRAGQSFRFAPHFAMTMRELNESVENRIADHAPMTVDLPMQEPGPLPE